MKYYVRAFTFFYAPFFLFILRPFIAILVAGAGGYNAHTHTDENNIVQSSGYFVSSSILCSSFNGIRYFICLALTLTDACSFVDMKAPSNAPHIPYENTRSDQPTHLQTHINIHLC